MIQPIQAVLGARPVCVSSVVCPLSLPFLTLPLAHSARPPWLCHAPSALPPPAALTLRLCPHILVALRLQLHFAEEEACQWQWYRQRDGSSPWEPLEGATARRYTPRPEDAGCRLRVECTPGRRGGAGAGAGAEAGPAAAELKLELELGPPGAAECGPVCLPPSPAAVAPRHVLTQQPTASPELRVVTYNILADQYAGTDVAKNVIFAHCPPE